jgi:hypothetical protein
MTKKINPQQKQPNQVPDPYIQKKAATNLSQKF